MRFNSNDECAVALFDYLKSTGAISGTADDLDDILHDINNLRGHEWLENVERNLTTKPIFDHIHYSEFSQDEFAYDAVVSPVVLLRAAVGKEYPEDITFDQVRDALDQQGFSDLWDYPTDELDEALSNISDDIYLVAVSFYYEAEGYFARMFEITEEMAKAFFSQKAFEPILESKPSLENMIQSADARKTNESTVGKDAKEIPLAER